MQVNVHVYQDPEDKSFVVQTELLEGDEKVG